MAMEITEYAKVHLLVLMAQMKEFSTSLLQLIMFHLKNQTQVLTNSNNNTKSSQKLTKEDEIIF
tara:strand:+ start:859 stop:1050 length:192 start_codon:yes stop_codon:yes gene_type:complete